MRQEAVRLIRTKMDKKSSSTFRLSLGNGALFVGQQPGGMLKWVLGAAGATDAALLRHHDQQGAEAAACLPAGPCQGGGGSEVQDCVHPAPAIPLHPCQA